LSVDQPRKHGAFDSRYPPVRHKPAPVSLWRLGEERRDWQGFLARFERSRRRHDFDTLAAYESYLNDAAGSPAGDPRPVGDATTTTDTEGRERDGGASTVRPRPARGRERPVGTQKV
jgi:hypothetical protein